MHRNSAAYRKGVIFGVLSGVAMAGSTLLIKVGAVDIDPVAATQIRVFTAFIGFSAVVLFSPQKTEVRAALGDKKSLSLIALGSVFGPFIGVGCLLFALQHAEAGIVSTITSLSPVLIIPPSIFIFKRHVSPWEIVGACVAVGGVSLLFI